MDLKTLEYMESRSKKARELVDKIRSFKKIAEHMENADGKERGLTIALSDKRGSYERESLKISNSYSAECLSDKTAFSIFKQSIIDGFNVEISKLQKELDEI